MVAIDLSQNVTSPHNDEQLEAAEVLKQVMSQEEYEQEKIDEETKESLPENGVFVPVAEQNEHVTVHRITELETIPEDKPLEEVKVVKPELNGASTVKLDVAKPAAKYIRWNLLLTVGILTTLSFPFWFPFIPILSLATLEVIIATIAAVHVVWLIATINASYCMYKLYQENKRDLKTQPIRRQQPGGVLNGHLTGTTQVRHLVGVCMYKEPLELMFHTVDSLSKQSDCMENMTVVVGLEMGTPQREQKTKELQRRYEGRFERFYVAAHPRGLEGEIPGKCSNFNWATREAVKALKQDTPFEFNQDNMIVTTADCDSIFPPKYFELLEMDFLALSDNQRTHTVWQSPLFYHMGMEKSPFFVRVTGYLRAFFMMGLLIPFSINTMSIFSMSLKLYEDGDYTHPGYQMDDIIALIRWTLKVRRRLQIRPIYVPTLSGATSGKNYCDEINEWALQIRRWTIGAAEVFHYFAVKARRIPCTAACYWAMNYIFYYCAMLCVTPIYSIIAPPIAVAMLQAQGRPVRGCIIPNVDIFTWILLGMLGLQYFWFAMVFVLNWLANRILPKDIHDKTPAWKNPFHWLATLITIVGYCLVELAAFAELTIRGKDICQHKPSKKDHLNIFRKLSKRISDAASSIRRATKASVRRLTKRLSRRDRS